MIISKKIAIKQKECCIVIEYLDSDSKKIRHRRIYLQDVITSNSPELDKDKLFDKIYKGVFEKHHSRYIRNVDRSLLKELVFKLIVASSQSVHEQSDINLSSIDDSASKDVSHETLNDTTMTDDHLDHENLDHSEQPSHLEEDSFAHEDDNHEQEEDTFHDDFNDDFQDGYDNFEFDDENYGDDINDEHDFDDDNFTFEEDDNFGIENDDENDYSRNKESEHHPEDDIDLNKVSEEELEKAKKGMDKNFEKNRLKPGDDGYQYEVEEDFSNMQKEPSGWDSD